MYGDGARLPSFDLLRRLRFRLRLRLKPRLISLRLQGVVLPLIAGGQVDTQLRNYHYY